MHLLLPLLASVLLVSALILINRAAAAGAGSLTVLFFANQFSAALFSMLWLFGGALQPWQMLWQPLVIAGLFMLGLLCTFLAVQRGDVSVATPVFGIKVVFVALLLTLIENETLPRSVWYGAALASLGIAMIQWTGRHHPRNVVLTILLALSAASCYATFDVLVQRWAPAWGAGRFLPITYWMVGILSLGMIPWVQWSQMRKPRVRRLVLPGALLIASQAICIVATLAVFGDAARVNVVYALRGLWAVVLAYAVAKRWGGAEAHLSKRVFWARLCGAGMLTVAVALAIGSEGQSR